MEQRDNILWLLKQAWYFSLTRVNDAVGEHGVRPGCADDGHGLLHAIRDPGHGHAAGLEQADQAAAVDRVIVDDDNA